jgi:hypothetical protein
MAIFCHNNAFIPILKIHNLKKHLNASFTIKVIITIIIVMWTETNQSHG